MTQNLIALGVVVVTGIWLVRHFVGVAKSGGCGSGCDAAKAGQPGRTAPDRGLKRTPLLPPDQIGLPPSSGESHLDD